MYEPFAFQVVKDILGPLYKKESSHSHRQVRFASQIEEIHEIVKHNFDIREVCGDATLKYVDQLVDCLLVNVQNPLELSKVEEFASGLLMTAFKNSNAKLIEQRIRCIEVQKEFGVNMAETILTEAVTDAWIQQKKLSIVTRFCEAFIDSHIKPTLACFDDVFAYTQSMSDEILRTSMHEAVTHMIFTKNISNFSEDLSKQVLKESFESVSYQKDIELLTKNAHAFAEKMVVDLFCDDCLLKAKASTSRSDINTFSEELCGSVLNEVYGDADLRAKLNPGNVEREYMSFILHNTVEPPDGPTDQSRPKSSNADSSNSSLLTVNRRDSCDTSSEALTPKSAIDESTWKKGLYQFADQLLYSLSHLEEEPRIPDIFVPTDMDTFSSKVRRSGSCPHILRIPSTVYEVPCPRRQSESLIRFAGGMHSFAENLASDIMLSSFLEF